MDLYILRHAWAESYGDPRWSEAQRPLTAEGRARFARMAEKLVQGDMSVQIIAASPLARCVETAEVLAQALPTAVEVVVRDELLPGSDLPGIIKWTAKQAERHEHIAWVGHSPDVDRMTAALVGDGHAMIRFAKGAAAALRFEDDRPDRRHGELRWLVTARLLGL